MITLHEFGIFCNQRACDGCWNMESAIRCMSIYKECIQQPFWKRNRYFKDHYGEIMTKFVEDTNKEIHKRKEGKNYAK